MRLSSRAMACAVVLLAASLTATGSSAAAAPRVLRVGTYKGHHGQFKTIQQAVDAARPGDWILVGPGVYHERGAPEAGVLVTTPNIHIRGMNRTTVLVDGTKQSAKRRCDAGAKAQYLGPKDKDGHPVGRNGIEVYKVDGVSIDNLTVCNFLANKQGDNGNEIWFNGGDGSGKIGMGSFEGSYLSATSTYFKSATSPMAMYGIFTSNEDGPGTISNTYASNMGDSDYYIGACPNCNVVLTLAHAENSTLGYSGTNSGGNLIIENSEWDKNKVGILPNSLNNDDAPPPQNGACPQGVTGPTGSGSCTIIEHNYVHDNNNPNVPAFGIAGNSPIGAGIELSGGQNDTVIDNVVENQGSWGIVVHDFPDTETPPPVSNCEGGTSGQGACFFPAFGDEMAKNVMSNNGFFGNPTNGDLADATEAHDPGNCFHDNTEKGGGAVSSDPPDIQTTMGTCGQPGQGDTGPLVVQLACASQLVGPCPDAPGATYPRVTKVKMLPLPPQSTMPNPCKGVPKNPWC